jgi:hypothetical protein
LQIVTTDLPPDVRMGQYQSSPEGPVPGDQFVGIRLQPRVGKTPQVTFTCTITAIEVVNSPPATMTLRCVGGAPVPWAWDIYTQADNTPDLYHSGPLI